MITQEKLNEVKDYLLELSKRYHDDDEDGICDKVLLKFDILVLGRNQCFVDWLRAKGFNNSGSFAELFPVDVVSPISEFFSFWGDHDHGNARRDLARYMSENLTVDCLRETL